MKDRGFKKLCKAQIHLAITDLADEKNRQSSLRFFLSENFRSCCKAIGYDYQEVIDVVYEMSKLTPLQMMVRGQQLIKKLEGQNVSSRRASGESH